MYRVCVPTGRSPAFPDACVGCGCQSPGQTARVRSAISRKWPGVPAVPLGEWAAEVPVCGPCGASIGDQRRGRFGLALACVTIGTCVAYFLAAGLGPPWRHWVMIGVVTASLLPYLAYERWFPRPVSLEVDAGWAAFSFRDPAYAAEFARLNGAGEDSGGSAEPSAAPDRGDVS